MADTTLNIAYLNPVKFYPKKSDYPYNYKTGFTDEFRFEDQLWNFEERVKYYQKWMQTDVIPLQFETDYTDLKIEVVGEYDQVVKTVVPQTVLSAINPAPNVFKNAGITLNDIPSGKYFLRIPAPPGKDVLESADFEVCDFIEQSVLLRYSNSTNDFNVAFDTGIVFDFRAEGGLLKEGFRPANKRKVYEDQNLNYVRLSATSYKVNKLEIGGVRGVPNWVPELVNNIFCCDTVSIVTETIRLGNIIDSNTGLPILDDTGNPLLAATMKQYTKEIVRMEGDMERRGEEYYPMATWTFDIREANNKHLTTY